MQKMTGDDVSEILAVVFRNLYIYIPHTHTHTQALYAKNFKSVQNSRFSTTAVTDKTRDRIRTYYDGKQTNCETVNNKFVFSSDNVYCTGHFNLFSINLFY